MPHDVRLAHTLNDNVTLHERIMRFQGFGTRWQGACQSVLQRHNHFGWKDPCNVREVGADRQMQLVVVWLLFAVLYRIPVFVDTRVFGQP